MPVRSVPFVSRFVSNDFEERFPAVWNGKLLLRNEDTLVQMHLLLGNVEVANVSLPPSVEGQHGPIRILQRIRLDQVDLEEKMQNMDGHCVLLVLPIGLDKVDLDSQANSLEENFVDYLIRKDAAGIVTVPGPDSAIPDHIIHIFPTCEFVDKHLARADPSLLYNRNLDNLSYLMIVITTA